ncbi:MAG TPA: patatin-like phospholipase family protein [Bacilli bacterium]|nr:patatin-like phospholipase family protein [Bacilli bacterium]
MKKNKTKFRNVGLMLGGGGAKGAYQLGVIRALEEYKLIPRIKAVSGVSIGAINGLLVATKVDLETRKAVWANFTNKNIYQKTFRSFSLEELGLFKTDHLFNDVKSLIDEEKIKKSKVDTFILVARPPEKGFLKNIRFKNFIGKTIHLNKSERPLEYINASTAMPFVFRAQSIEEARYVDGGVVNNFPVETLIDRGYKVIITCALSDRFDVYSYAPDVTLIDLSPPESLGPFPQVSLNFDESAMAGFEREGYNNTVLMIKLLKAMKHLTFFRRFKFKAPTIITIKDVLSLTNVNSNQDEKND